MLIKLIGRRETYTKRRTIVYSTTALETVLAGHLQRPSVSLVRKFYFEQESFDGTTTTVVQTLVCIIKGLERCNIVTIRRSVVRRRDEGSESITWYDPKSSARSFLLEDGQKMSAYLLRQICLGQEDLRDFLVD